MILPESKILGWKILQSLVIEAHSGSCKRTLPEDTVIVFEWITYVINLSGTAENLRLKTEMKVYFLVNY